MAETKMNCPGCGTRMACVSEPDVTYERCPGCDGLFFDRGELNILATGMSGDIEFCSIVADASFKDVHPPRRCPKCRCHVMEKQGLLGDEALILDRCPGCGAWFLDPGELLALNETLAETRQASGAREDYRREQRGRLVSVYEDVSEEAFGWSDGATLVEATWRSIDVWYTKPFGAGLFITPRTRLARLWALLGRTGITFGDEEFDRAFFVRAEDERTARRRLSATARRALLAFQQSPQGDLGRRHRFSVQDDRVTYAWSAWDKPDSALSRAEESDLANAIVDLAVALEPDSPRTP